MSKSAAVFNKKKFINDVTETVRHMYRKQLKEASQQEIFQAVSYVVKDVVIDDWLATQQAFDDQDPKIVYYMSMEFLMGRALGNNLINLKAYKEVKEALEEIGLNLDVIEDQEPDPALGNGGLGRLAACFMESLATLGYAAYGCGIRYRYGMFKQQISDGFQVEVPEDGVYELKTFYVSGTDRRYEISINGAEPIRTKSFNSGDWVSVAQDSIYVSLRAGENTITYANSDSDAPNLDRIAVSKAKTDKEPTASDDSKDETGTEEGSSYTYTIYEAEDAVIKRINYC